MQFAVALACASVLGSCREDVSSKWVDGSRGGKGVDALVTVLDHVSEHHTVAALVVGERLDPTVVAALGAFRLPVLSRDEVAGSIYLLPAGHLEITEVELGERYATVAATLGPVYAPRESVVLLSCGTNYRLSLLKEGTAGWKVAKSYSSVC